MSKRRDLLDKGKYLSQLIHNAVMNGQAEVLDSAIEEYDATAIQLNGGKRMGMAVEPGGLWLLNRHCRAKDGQIPHWGQDGDFPLIVQQIPVQVKFRWRRFGFPSFEFRSIWPGRFFSDTGFQAHSMHEYVAGVTVEQAVRLILSSKKLVSVVPISQRVAR